MAALHHLPLLPNTSRRIQDWFLRGYPIAVIARSFSIHRMTVCHHTKHLPRRKAVHSYDENFEALICARYRAGWGKMDFRNHMHIHWRTIKKILQKHEITLRPTGRPRGKIRRFS